MATVGDVTLPDGRQRNQDANACRVCVVIPAVLGHSARHARSLGRGRSAKAGGSFCYTRLMSQTRRPKGRVTVRARVNSIDNGELIGGSRSVTLKTRSGQVTITRHSQTGRFTAVKSAKVIDRGALRFAASLKRLATK